jgi:hypothetical protein
MSDLICPFSAPLVAQDFACRYGEAVIRRGGTEIACRADASYARCIELHQAMKAVALADAGYEDDLTQVPHSLLVKIQYGGLLGLQRLTGNDSESATTVADIDRLVESALARFGTVSGIPCAELCADMTAYRLPGRRRGRKR